MVCVLVFGFFNKILLYNKVGWLESYLFTRDVYKSYR